MYLLSPRFKENIHIVTHIQQHDWFSTTWQQFTRGPDGRQTGMRTMSSCTPVQSESHTSWDSGSFQDARSQTAGPATACEERCASWHQSGCGLRPWCSWGPSVEFHTWTVFCPDPTGGPLCASDQRPCSVPASSSSLWRWQPSVASWPSRISLGSLSPVLRTQIQSQCSWLGETSWFSVEESNQTMTSDKEDPDTVKQLYYRSFQFRSPQRSSHSYSPADVQAVCPCVQIFLSPDSGQPEESKVSMILKTVREWLL